MPDLSVKALLKKYGAHIVLGIILVMACGVFLRGIGAKENYDVVCFGDSIIGNVRDESSIPGVLESLSGKRVLNAGFGGMSLACVNDLGRGDIQRDGFSLVGIAESAVAGDFSVQKSSLDVAFIMDYYEETVRSLETVNWDKVEVLVIEHGVNDYMMGMPLDNEDELYDIYTFGGSLRYVLRLLQEKWPSKRIILCTPTYCWFPEKDSDCGEDNGYGTLEAYVNLEKEIAEEFGVEVLDNYYDSEIGKEGVSPLDYTVDGLHLNEEGRRHIAERIAECIGR